MAMVAVSSCTAVLSLLVTTDGSVLILSQCVAVMRFLVALLICLALPVGATPPLEQEQEIRTSFVTPHTEEAAAVMAARVDPVFIARVRQKPGFGSGCSGGDCLGR